VRIGSNPKHTLLEKILAAKRLALGRGGWKHAPLQLRNLFAGGFFVAVFLSCVNRIGFPTKIRISTKPFLEFSHADARGFQRRGFAEHRAGSP